MTAMWLQRRFDRLAQDPKRQARWLLYAVGFYTVLRADVALFLLCLVAVAFGRVLENRAYDLEFYKERSVDPYDPAQVKRCNEQVRRELVDKGITPPHP